MLSPYEQSLAQSRQLSQKMRMGTGVAMLLNSPQVPTHYIDTLERFQKDYAAYDKIKRQQQLEKRRRQLQRKRIEQLQRQTKRWQLMEEYDRKIKSRQEQHRRIYQFGTKRTANRNGLAYNPINLQYEQNPEGQKLKYQDQQAKIRNFVRAHNMDRKGNCKFNPLNGQDRLGIDLVVPSDLKQRYEHRLNEHYQNQRLKPPTCDYTIKSSPFL